jgi:hypothetical protein
MEADMPPHDRAPAPIKPHDRCTLLACAWGAATAVVEALDARAGAAAGNPWIKFQRDAFSDLAELLHHMTALNDRRIDKASFRDLWRLMRRRLRFASALSRHGPPLEKLLQIAEPRPPGRLPVSVWSLAWISVTRLAEALDAVIAASPTPRRLEQAKAVGALEAALRHVLAPGNLRPARAEVTTAGALDAFDAADRALGGEVAQIFVEEARCRPRPVQAA